MKYMFAGILSFLYFISTDRIEIGVAAIVAGILAAVLEPK